SARPRPLPPRPRGRTRFPLAGGPASSRRLDRCSWSPRRSRGRTTGGRSRSPSPGRKSRSGTPRPESRPGVRRNRTRTYAPFRVRTTRTFLRLAPDPESLGTFAHPSPPPPTLYRHRHRIRGGFHRARHRARHGPGPGAPGDLAARPHDLRAHPGPDPPVLRRGQGHLDRQWLRLRVPPDDPPLRALGHGRPRGRLPRWREYRGPARHGRPREAGRAHAGGDPAPRARGTGVHVPPDDHINIGYAG